MKAGTRRLYSNKRQIELERFIREGRKILKERETELLVMQAQDRLPTFEFLVHPRAH